MNDIGLRFLLSAKHLCLCATLTENNTDSRQSPGALLKAKQPSAHTIYCLLQLHLKLHVRMKHRGTLHWLQMQMRRGKINFTSLTFWTDNAVLPHLTLKISIKPNTSMK